jgi:outer membrane receptor protein involved in Fe transport
VVIQNAYATTTSYFLSNPRYDDYSEGNYPIQFPVAGLDGNTVSGYTIDQNLGNPLLKPEKQFSWEVGTDITFLKDYVNFEYTYYDRRDKDLIVEYSITCFFRL